jgi:uncharacterized protein (DUF849 family)
MHLQTETLRIFGEGNFNWSVIGVGYPRQYTLGAMAIGMFGHVRVGMEDNLYVRPGVLAKSNLDMVEDIKTIATICGRELATPDEAREILGLKGGQGQFLTSDSRDLDYDNWTLGTVV